MLGLHKGLEIDRALLGAQIQPACAPCKAEPVVDWTTLIVLCHVAVWCLRTKRWENEVSIRKSMVMWCAIGVVRLCKSWPHGGQGFSYMLQRRSRKMMQIAQGHLVKTSCGSNPIISHQYIALYLHLWNSSYISLSMWIHPVLRFYRFTRHANHRVSHCL